MNAGGMGAEQAAELLERALTLPPDEQRMLLDRVHVEDEPLAREVGSLLAAHEAWPDGLDTLAERVLPGVIEDVGRALSRSAPIEGQTIGRYRILTPIGRGGMGEVFKAVDTELDRPVALKFLAPSLTADPDAQARLRAEARATSALDHRNIAVIYEIGVMEPVPGDAASDRLFIAMAYYPGETIRDKVARGPIPVTEAVAYAIQLAAGLARAHEAGIVHRDIKPANVIVTDRGEVKILDFGIAKLAGVGMTMEGTTFGTVDYMSPEQTRGEAVDHRTDIWSFGVMLYEMLTARRPFPGTNAAVVIHGIRDDDPEPLHRLVPGIDDELARVVETCLAKDPAARYRQTDQLLAGLRAVAAGAPAEPRVRGRASVTRRAVLTGGLVATMALAGALALSGSAGVARLIGRAGGPAVIQDRHGPRIAILPFAPVVTDSSLQRMGRDLVVTLTAGLDGLGEVRAVDASTTLALLGPERRITLEAAHGLARRLSADRFIHGALTRAGTDLRLDASLHEVGAAEPLARATVTGGDLETVSDAAIIALLDGLWQREPPAVPSLAALSGSTVPAARRAYIAGELALSRSDMGPAIDAFERAFAADTTFWWAYWRSLYPRAYRETAPADAALVQKVIDHRWELPEPDRRLIEATRLSRSLTEQLLRLRLLLDDFPGYEPAWWEYANRLVHNGGYLGYTIEDARSALERVLALNPRFVAAWDHLQWVELVQGDSATAMRAGREASRLAGDTTLPSLRNVRASLAGTGPIGAESLEELVDFVLASPPGLSEGMSSGLVADGALARQIQLNRAVRQRTSRPALSAALWRGEALAWAARGAWDSAFVATDRWVRASGGTDGDAELGAYRLAVAGVLVNALPAAAAGQRRSAAARAISRWGLETDCQTPAADLDSAARPAGPPVDRLACAAQVREAVYRGSDLAWLDGLLAYLAQNPEGIAAARRTLSIHSSRQAPVPRQIVSPWDSVSRPLLDRSLAALALDAAGDRRRAIHELVAVETEIANRLAVNHVGAIHPLLPIANRMLAARWLRSVGDDAEAALLLHWHEAIPGLPLVQAWNRAIGSISLLDRAEIAESVGDLDRAQRDYGRFLRWYDLADPALQPLVERATAGLDRLKEDHRR